MANDWFRVSPIFLPLYPLFEQQTLESELLVAVELSALLVLRKASYVMFALAVHHLPLRGEVRQAA